jgi:hypothetical protein
MQVVTGHAHGLWICKFITRTEPIRLSGGRDSLGCNARTDQ